jgi:hypothetical protein
MNGALVSKSENKQHVTNTNKQRAARKQGEQKGQD